MRTVSQRTTTAQNKLDRLIQQYYVPQYDKCIVCGNPCEVMHHYVQKKQSTYLRYDPKNLINLCHRCHCKHHQAGDPTIVATIAKKKGDGWLDWIESHRHTVVKRNLAYLEELQAKIKQLNQSEIIK